MNYPKIGVYAGSGTSHSWLWFVDLFEKAGFYDLVFLDEFFVQKNEIKNLDVLVVSGGDTFAVAQSLGEKSGRNIKSFVENGGVYIGSCAGAYLPMKSSKKPLDWFNFVDVKITNLSKLFPSSEIQTCKSCAAYGYDFVFHPVREAVTLKTTCFFDKDKSYEFTAPLYGGPGMKASDPSWVLAVYEGFTPKTAFFTTREIAEKTLVSNGAVVRVPFKEGCFYLLGPHLEHPKFKQANQFIIDAVIRETGMAHDPVESKNKKKSCTTKEKLSGKRAKELLLCIKRELSNSRIVAGSLEFLPVQWLIGQKVYEPQKVRVYLESMWKRLRALEKNKVLILEPGLYDRITHASSQ
ncbi:MAG: Type 1 glutamine amidotransferase-like domain-containing protein, partial [Proteobacteria bacterium]|nr:Type 1 glutamine amidotransferase-like domain-containing protein [Pseudomonadota bacterium]